MVKNIILASLGFILVGALAVAAFDYATGNSSLELPPLAANAGTLLPGTGPQGQGIGPGQGRGQGQQHGQGFGGGAGQQGDGQGQGFGNGTGEPIDHEWLTLSGSVISLGAQGLQVDTVERGELLLSLGRPGFADQQGVAFAPGDAVTIQGFDSPQGQFVAGVISNDTSGQSLLLRDPNGRPLWAGPGRGQGGGGQGQGQGAGGTQ